MPSNGGMVDRALSAINIRARVKWLLDRAVGAVIGDLPRARPADTT